MRNEQTRREFRDSDEASTVYCPPIGGVYCQYIMLIVYTMAMEMESG